MSEATPPQRPPRSRPMLIIALALVIGLGLGSRRYGSSLPAFLADNAGDALWTVAAFIGLAILFPGWTSTRLGLAALAASFGVEFSQLIDLDWLNSIRRNRIARLFLGSGFVWLDLVRYFVGSCLVTTIDHMIRIRFAGKPEPANQH